MATIFSEGCTSFAWDSPHSDITTSFSTGWLQLQNHCETEDFLGLEEMDRAIPALTATPTQMPLWVTTPGDILSFLYISPLLQPTVLKTPETASVYMLPPRVVPATLPDKRLPLQKKMNTTLEQLLTVRSSRDLCYKELNLNGEQAAHLNEVQNAEAIRQARLHGETVAYNLQQAHKESVLVLEHQVTEEERQACQAFMGAFGVAIGACLPKNWGTLLYPLQLLTNNVLLAALLGMLATTQLWAVADGGPKPVTPIPGVSGMPAPLMGIKYWCHSSDQGVLPQSQKRKKWQNSMTHLKNILTENIKRVDWQLRFWKNLAEKPSPRGQRSSKQPGRPITRLTSPILSMRGRKTSPVCFERWLPPLTSGAQRSMRCRRTGTAGGNSELPTSSQSPHPRASISSGS